jgi:hypothetical protein
MPRLILQAKPLNLKRSYNKSIHFSGLSIFNAGSRSTALRFSLLVASAYMGRRDCGTAQGGGRAASACVKYGHAKACVNTSHDRPPLFTRALCRRFSARRAARQNHWAVLQNHWEIFSRDAGDFFKSLGEVFSRYARRESRAHCGICCAAGT